MIFFLIPILLLMAGTGYVYRPGHKTRKRINNLSWAGRSVYKSYMELPPDSRPYGDVLEMMEALDTKYGYTEINEHFRTRNYGNSGPSFNPSWNCNCWRNCQFKEYRNISVEIGNVKRAIEDRNYKMKIAGISTSLSAVEDFTNALRTERELINTVTKELT